VTLTAVAATAVAVLLGAAGRGRPELYRALGNLAEVVHLIRANYVDPVDLDRLERGLEAGLLESVDRRAAIVRDRAAFARRLASAPAFGLLLGRRLGAAAVGQVWPGSPAEAAGLEAGEVIEKLDGVRTRTSPLYVLRRMLGDAARAGRAVELVVLDREVENRRTVTLEPRPWDPVASAVRVEERDGVTVVRLVGVPQGTAGRLRALAAGGRALVLDLRATAWGVEDEALAVADLFAGSGELGAWRGGRAGERRFEAHPGSVAPPPVVCIGPDTQEAGELLASALERAGAVTVGETTAGWAPHRTVVSEGTLSLCIPVAFWLAPDGHALDEGEGLEPGERVEPAETGDAVLERALELARGERAQAA